MAVAGLVVIALAVVTVLVLTGGTNSLPLVSENSPSPVAQVPALDLRLTHATGVATSATTKKAQLQGAAHQVAPAVDTILTRYYVAAFLDPANWQAGTYEGAFSAFAPKAAAEATRRLQAMTAGAGAGDLFTAIRPKKGTLKVEVLVDPSGKPYSAIATVRFVAEGAGKDGSAIEMATDGQFSLDRVGGGWKIVAFNVERHDTRKATRPSASASPSAAGASS